MSIFALIAIYAGLLAAAFAIGATVKAYRRKAHASSMVSAHIGRDRMLRVVYNADEDYKAFRTLR